MRVLWLTPELPYAPGGSGGSTRQFELIRRLVEHGHAIEVVAPVHPTQRDGARRLADAGASLRGVHRRERRAGEALAALANRPRLALDLLARPLVAWQVEVFWSSLRRLADAAIAAARPDVIVVEHDWAAGWASALPPGIPRVLTLHNLSWAYYEARAAVEPVPRRWAFALEARRFRRYDAARLADFDLLLTMSEQDRRLLGSVTSTPSAVVPNGVDVSRPPSPLPAPSPDPLLVFAGTLSYPPNRDAALWLAGEIWPLIRARHPAARLRIVGRGAPPELAGHAHAGVEVTGWAESMEPHFAEASAVLVPIRSGAGTRLKVLDGLAAGRPVVSTSLGADGIAVRDGEHLVIADGARELAAAAAAVLADPSRAAALASAGRALVERHYGWPALGDRMDAELAALVRRQPSAAA